MSINQKLHDLYSSKWDKLSEELLKEGFGGVEPTNPLLIYIGDEEKYLNSDFKIMVFGQETNDWEGPFNGQINPMLETYDKFYNSEACYNGRIGPFWRGVKRFNDLLGKKFQGKTVEVLWNNTVKIGKKGEKNMPSDKIIDIEVKYFNVISSEVEILKPDLLLFLSGPNYDRQINLKIKNTQFEIDGYSLRKLAKLEIDSTRYAFRTYHPNYLSRKKMTDDYFSVIINQISD